MASDFAANGSPMVMGNPATDALNPEVRARIAEGIKQALSVRYASLRHMDDVKIKGALLKYEVGEEDFVLTRQSE